jgi:CRISPR-associated protein Cas6
MGDRLPADHNYRLYSALVEALPGLKDCEWHLKTINGIPDHQGWIKLGRQSRLGIRCDLGLLEVFSALDQRLLRVGQSFIELGALQGQTIQPTNTLRSRLVTIKQAGVGTFDDTMFAVALGKQLGEAGIKHLPIIRKRRTLRIKDCTVIGFEVTFPRVSQAESLILQRHGLGGRHRMGCGVFWDG